MGAPTWFETLSGDYAQSTAFYRDVFGWDLHVMGDSDEFRYSTLGQDADAKAGIMDASGFLGDQPSRWQFYVEVADTDATVAQAVELGATVVRAAVGHAVRPAGVPPGPRRLPVRRRAQPAGLTQESPSSQARIASPVLVERRRRERGRRG